MNYQDVTVGTVIARISRFTVLVALGGQEVPVHLNNTGRNRELLVPGFPVSVRFVDHPGRKTQYDLLAIHRDGRWINIDSLAPNRVLKEALLSAKLVLPGLPNPYQVRPETTWRDARLDFFGRAANMQPWFVEAKGVTLLNTNLAAFPDAPTPRAVKHVHTLTQAIGEGYHSFLIFVIQAPNITQMTLYQQRLPELVTAITAARAQGLTVLSYCCETGPDFIRLDHQVPFDETLPFEEITP